jgi:hypothetical protein
MRTMPSNKKASYPTAHLGISSFALGSLNIVFHSGRKEINYIGSDNHS